MALELPQYRFQADFFVCVELSKKCLEQWKEGRFPSRTPFLQSATHLWRFFQQRQRPERYRD